MNLYLISRVFFKNGKCYEEHQCIIAAKNYMRAAKWHPQGGKWRVIRVIGRAVRHTREGTVFCSTIVEKPNRV